MTVARDSVRRKTTTGSRDIFVSGMLQYESHLLLQALVTVPHCLFERVVLHGVRAPHVVQLVLLSIPTRPEQVLTPHGSQITIRAGGCTDGCADQKPDQVHCVTVRRTCRGCASLARWRKKR